MRVPLLTLAATVLVACGHINQRPTTPPSDNRWASYNHDDVPLTPSERQIVEILDLNPQWIEDLRGRPIHTFSPREVDMYLRFLRRNIPDLRQRIQHIGRQNLGQHYEIYLLGEFPYEIYDPQPTYRLDASDCVVFSEHTYAMAMGHDWASFYRILQRIRYKDGEVGILTRNHWTLPYWDVNNAWMLEDVTEQIGDGQQWSTLQQTVQPSHFFMRRFGLGADLPDEPYTHTYIPLENIENVLDDLRPGDFVNVIRGSEQGGWAGHTGLISQSEDGTLNFLHSTPPRVIEQPWSEVLANIRERNARNADNPRYAQTIGYKFLRLRADDLEEEFAVTDEMLRLPIPDPDFGRESHGE